MFVHKRGIAYYGIGNDLYIPLSGSLDEKCKITRIAQCLHCRTYLSTYLIYQQIFTFINLIVLNACKGKVLSLWSTYLQSFQINSLHPRLFHSLYLLNDIRTKAY